MRNVRSYLSAQEVRELQPHTYCRLNMTVGGTYGSSYKRRYGTGGRSGQALFTQTADQAQALLAAGTAANAAVSTEARAA